MSNKVDEADSNLQLQCYIGFYQLIYPPETSRPKDKARGESYAIPKGKKSFKTVLPHDRTGKINHFNKLIRHSNNWLTKHPLYSFARLGTCLGYITLYREGLTDTKRQPMS